MSVFTIIKSLISPQYGLFDIYDGILIIVKIRWYLVLPDMTLGNIT